MNGNTTRGVALLRISSVSRAAELLITPASRIDEASLESDLELSPAADQHHPAKKLVAAVGSRKVLSEKLPGWFGVKNRLQSRGVVCKNILDAPEQCPRAYAPRRRRAARSHHDSRGVNPCFCRQRMSRGTHAGSALRS